MIKKSIKWRCLRYLFAGFCFWQALPSADRSAGHQAVAAVAPNSSPRAGASPARRPLTRPIQEIQVGHRVLADNPELRGQEIPQAFFDAENTRLVVLHQIKSDGHELTVETLLPLDLLAAAVAERLDSDTGLILNPLPLVGSAENVALNELLIGHPLELNMPELGAAGPAQIVAVQPCPSFEPDDGTGRRLVTSVFHHSAANVIDLSTSGSDESIGVTTNHPFWSEDRQAFVPAGELRQGERLRNADGSLTQVTRLIPHTGPPVPVFNFEVDGQHVYSVGADGLLVHNDCHHIVSTYGNASRGWNPNWTQGAQDILKNARINLSNGLNKVNLASHYGPHPELYHKKVFERLQDAVGKARPGSALYVQRVEKELGQLAADLKKLGLNGLQGIGL